MSITRIIALAVLSGSLALTAAHGQTLRRAQPPAEFPPASFKGKQYVDSRGCIYIRAGIDGNTTWVPRVSRERKQVCGFQPTKVAGATKAPAAASQPTLITVDPAARPAASAATTAKPAPAKPKLVAKPSPVAKPKPATKKPIPTVASTISKPKKKVVRKQPVRTVAPAPAPVQIAPRPAQQPADSSGGCANASALSQRYINTGPGVRCGPQAESPITYGNGSGIGPQSSLYLTPNTRVVQRHIYDNRQNTRNVEVPEGYRTVWGDDRLNTERAERGLKPAVLSTYTTVPHGYRPVDRDDDRLNPLRGVRTAAGDHQTAQIWEDGLPRTLRSIPTDRPIVTLSERAAKSPAEAKRRGMRLSTRSAEGVGAPKIATKRYVRVATYSSDAEARQVARQLAGSGLPMRMGSVTRGGAKKSVVLAGPFADSGKAQAALQRLRGMGYSAHLSK